jgi:metallo-beta-lactamase class B
MEEKYAKLGAGGTNPYVDPNGYKNYISEREQAFLEELRTQSAALKKP